jgi:hypothetical protein
MPRDWRADPLVIERHCTCTFRKCGTGDGASIIVERDGTLMRLARIDPNCKLHGTNPSHDLPEGV